MDDREIIRRLTKELDLVLDENKKLKEQQKKAIDTAVFYQNNSGNKATLKFGYSRVVEELNG